MSLTSRGIPKSLVIQALLSAGIARLSWTWWRKKRKTRLIVPRAEGPLFATKDMPHIMSGFRKPCSICGCFCSCGAVHNETFNIWSHWLAMLWFSRVAWSTKELHKYTAGSAAWLFFISAIAHTLASASERVNKFIFSLDRASIGIYFCASSVVTGLMHFRSRGEFEAAKIHQIVTIVAGIASSSALFFGSFFPNYLKVGVLSIQAAFGVLPAVREMLMTPSPEIRSLVRVYLPLSTLSGLLGGICFSLRIPEALFAPGTFDTFGSGHNLMHIFVIIAVHLVCKGQGIWANALRRLATKKAV